MSNINFKFNTIGKDGASIMRGNEMIVFKKDDVFKWLSESTLIISEKDFKKLLKKGKVQKD